MGGGEGGLSEKWGGGEGGFKQTPEPSLDPPLFILLEYPIHNDIISMELSILYF